MLRALTLAAGLLLVAPSDSRFLRLSESSAALRLEVAVRVLRAPRAEGPDAVVSLVGAVHVAEQAYYDALQAYLDRQDVVLFEHVLERPPELPADLGPAAQGRVAATLRRLETLARAALAQGPADGGAASVEALRAAVAGQPRAGARLERAARDAWGREALLEREAAGAGVVARSLGADGEPGGEGEAADLAVRLDAQGADADQRGLQGDLADALGLVFQLDGIDYLGERWRNSDVSLAELQDLLAEHDADAASLIGALEGSSLVTRFAGGLLRLLGATESGRGMLRLVGLEVLSRADELFAAPPPELAPLLRVLIEERNRVVAADLAAVLEQEPEATRVAIFYGAGHLADLEARLVEELGLVPLRELWLPAVELRWEDSGMTREEAAFLRRTIQRQLDAQLGAARRR